MPKRHRLAAFFCCMSLSWTGTALPATTPQTTLDVDTTSTLSPTVQHEVMVEKVEAGQERAILSARLTDASTTATANMAWRIKTAAGHMIYDKKTPKADLALPPGFYAVELNHNGIVLEEAFTLLEGHSMTINFVLNAGALRILPKIKAMAVPGIVNETKIYALAGPNKGQLIRRSNVPGEVISLVQGRYRIESRPKLSNAVAVVDVKIAAGIMSAVEINHRAGLARLSYVGAPNADVEWEIRRGSTMELAHINGLNATVVLSPGRYIAVARVGNERLTASFEIAEGETRDIMLGN
jgi:hypothetical protein